MLRVKGQGDAGRNEGAAGDLYITFAIKPRAGIMRSGLDLYSEVQCSPAVAPVAHSFHQSRPVRLQVSWRQLSAWVSGDEVWVV